MKVFLQHAYEGKSTELEDNIRLLVDLGEDRHLDICTTPEGIIMNSFDGSRAIGTRRMTYAEWAEACC